jgi:hypothetical protein
VIIPIVTTYGSALTETHMANNNTSILLSKEIIEAEFIDELNTTIPPAPKVPVIVIQDETNTFIWACCIAISIGVIIGAAVVLLIKIIK